MQSVVSKDHRCGHLQILLWNLCVGTYRQVCMESFVFVDLGSCPMMWHQDCKLFQNSGEDTRLQTTSLATSRQVNLADKETALETIKDTEVLWGEVPLVDLIWSAPQWPKTLGTWCPHMRGRQHWKWQNRLVHIQCENTRNFVLPT